MHRPQQFRKRLETLEQRLTPSFGPIGPDFRVNITIAGEQARSHLAAAENGTFVVVWDTEKPDGNLNDVYARRFNADGAPAGDEFRVNSYATGRQGGAKVASAADGRFVIVWTDSSGNDGNVSGIFGQLYSASGEPVGEEFQANSYTANSQGSPWVAMADDGSFVVTWESNGQDGNLHGIYGQRYDASGATVGIEFRINQQTTGDQLDVRVAMDNAGSFVTMWTEYAPDYLDSRVFARLWNSNGSPRTGEFLVADNALSASLATGPQGGFVLAVDYVFADGVVDSKAQRFNSAGERLGSEIPITATPSDNQGCRSIAVDQAGNFVVVWMKFGPDGGEFGGFAQRFDAAGDRVGAEFQVNSYTTGQQLVGDVGIDSDGDFVIAWPSIGQDPDGSTGVYARRFHANRLPTTSGIPDILIPAGQATELDLSNYFSDADDGLTFAVTGNTNPSLFGSVAINGSSLSLTPTGPNGSSTLTVRALDPDNAYIEAIFTVTVAGAAPVVAGATVNSGAAQRSRITELSVTFNGAVTFAGPVASAFTLTRTGGGAVSFTATVDIVNGVTVVALSNFTGPQTQSGSLRDGNYMLTVLASQISAGGQPMSANYEYGFHRFFGDMNGDRRVDISDFGVFSLAYMNPSNYNAALDFNGDGRIDIADFGQFSVRFFTTLP